MNILIVEPASGIWTQPPWKSNILTIRPKGHAYELRKILDFSRNQAEVQNLFATVSTLQDITVCAGFSLSVLKIVCKGELYNKD